MSKNPKLGVVMMAGGDRVNRNPDALRRALESAKPIATTIYLLDTGLEGEAHAVARELADVIEEKPWNNDFGAMRSASLAMVDEPWAFILDSDDEICYRAPHMVIKTELKKEQDNGRKWCALEIQDWGENGQVCSWMQPRIVDPQLVVYEGVIHHQPRRLNGQEDEPWGVYRRIYVKHWGYALDAQTNEEKRLNTLARSLERIEEGELKYHFYAAEQYGMGDEWDKVIEHGSAYLDYKDYLIDAGHFDPSIYYLMAAAYIKRERLTEAKRIIAAGLQHTGGDPDLGYMWAEVGVAEAKWETVAEGSMMHIEGVLSHRRNPMAFGRRFIFRIQDDHLAVSLHRLRLARARQFRNAHDMLQGLIDDGKISQDLAVYLDHQFGHNMQTLQLSVDPQFDNYTLSQAAAWDPEEIAHG